MGTSDQRCPYPVATTKKSNAEAAQKTTQLLLQSKRFQAAYLNFYTVAHISDSSESGWLNPQAIKQECADFGRTNCFNNNTLEAQAQIPLPLGTADARVVAAKHPECSTKREENHDFG